MVHLSYLRQKIEAMIRPEMGDSEPRQRIEALIRPEMSDSELRMNHARNARTKM
jgi:hypothetical protein